MTTLMKVSTVILINTWMIDDYVDDIIDHVLDDMTMSMMESMIYDD